MKISCQSCQAKYTIADEKVLGKIVKIRCKKCGATIVINGNDPDAASSAQTGGAGYDDSAGGDPWTVNVADGDQRTMTIAEVVHEYKAGTVNDETFCWKDGMNDWLPLREIDTLYQACTMGGGADYAPSLHEAQPAAAAPAMDSFSGGGALFGGGAAAAAAHADTNGNGSGGGLFSSHPPPAAAAASATSSAAARRTGGRGAGGADLFGGVAQAGGEDDVMTSAPAGVPPSAGGAEGKLTGQRNENSVLFSLSALTSNPTAPSTSGGGGGGGLGESKTTASGDGSGLIDIRALSATMANDTGPKSNKAVDDIMNLGGGGAFSAALAAPVLAPPTQDLSDYASGSGAPSGQNKTTLYAIIGGCVFIGIAIIVAAVMFSKGGSKDETASTAPTGSAAGTDTAAATGAPTGAGTATAAPADTGAGAAPIATGVANNGSSGSSGAAHHAGGSAGSTGAGTHKAGGGGGDDTSAAANTPPPAAPKGPADLLGAMNAAAGGGAAPAHTAAATSSAPFDRGAAAASLGSINVASCKKGDGPTGSGHVRVTFQPSGTVSTVEVDQPPFSGTTVGGCVAGKFRSAHVPPFGGGPVTVGKSFNLN